MEAARDRTVSPPNRRPVAMHLTPSRPQPPTGPTEHGARSPPAGGGAAGAAAEEATTELSICSCSSVHARTAARRLWLQLVLHLGALIVRVVSEGVDASGIEVHLDSRSVDRSAVLAVGARYRRRYTLELAALRCSQGRD